MDRRSFLWRAGGGLGGIALSYLLGNDGLLAAAAGEAGRLNGGLHHRAKAKRVVQLFMSGAASQCDTFDYKPELIKRDGQKFDPGGKVELFQSFPGNCMKSPWTWKQYGQCGKWISDLVPHLAECVDDMAFIHSMVSKSNVHGPATFMQATGFVLPGFPEHGRLDQLRPGQPDATTCRPSWSCPTRAASRPTARRTGAPASCPPPTRARWSAPAPQPHRRSVSPRRRAGRRPPARPRGWPCSRSSTASTRQTRPGDSRLDARIASYELAANCS